MRTVSFWLAADRSDAENGCLRVVRGNAIPRAVGNTVVSVPKGSLHFEHKTVADTCLNNSKLFTLNVNTTCKYPFDTDALCIIYIDMRHAALECSTDTDANAIGYA